MSCQVSTPMLDSQNLKLHEQAEINRLFIGGGGAGDGAQGREFKELISLISYYFQLMFPIQPFKNCAV